MVDHTLPVHLPLPRESGSTEHVVNVDDALGKLLATVPISSNSALDAQRLPDGRYRCALTPQVITADMAVLLNGRLIVAEGAAQCLQDFWPSYFYYLSLDHAYQALTEFGQLLSSSYTLKLQQLMKLPNHRTSKDQFLIDVLTHKFLVKEVTRYMDGSRNPPLPDNIEALHSLRSQFETRGAICNYQDQVYQRLRELMRKIRFNISNTDDEEEFFSLFLESIGLSILLSEER